MHLLQRYVSNVIGYVPNKLTLNVGLLSDAAVDPKILGYSKNKVGCCYSVFGCLSKNLYFLRARGTPFESVRLTLEKHYTSPKII